MLCAPFASALRARRCRLRGFALYAIGTAARLEHLHQPLGKRLRLGILPDAADVFQIVQRCQDVGPLPRRECHTVHVYRLFLR